MREIKFRAFDAATKQYWVPKPQRMIYFDIMHVPDFIGNTHNENIADGKEIWERRFSIMQFTGMHDKYGVPIYEGDVLIEENNRYWLVSFLDGRFIAHVPDTIYNFVDLDDYLFCVVGNIHQHAHLLENK